MAAWIKADTGVGPSNEAAAMDPEMAAHPQPMFKLLRDEMPVMDSGDIVVVSRKADVDTVLRDAATFSSNVDAVDLSNRRPLIPLQIDPPEHKKFRKLLDPLFAPREVAKLEESLTAAVDELIDAFIDRGEVDFSAEFSTLFPTRVFLGLLGLPVEELPAFLEMKDGIIRPNVVLDTTYGSPEAKAYQQGVADSIYGTSRPSSTSVRPSPTTTC